MTKVQPNIYTPQFKSVCLNTFKSDFTTKTVWKSVPLLNEHVARIPKKGRIFRFSYGAD